MPWIKTHITVLTNPTGKQSDSAYFGWRYDREGVHDSVGVLLSDLGNQEGAHPRASSTTQRVCQLKSLKTVTALCFFPHHIKNRVNQFSALCVVSLGPVVTCSRLSENKIVWSENLAKRPRPDGVHGARLKVNKNGARDIFTTWKNKQFFFRQPCDFF